MADLKKLALDAINVQNACNPLGVSKAYAQMLTDLYKALETAGEPCHTDAMCKHPVHRLWASKIHDLAGMGLSDSDRFHDAYTECRRLAGLE